jgi:folate-binding protein YgfZ
MELAAAAAADAYEALEARIVLFDRSGRGRLEVTGPDRAKFLHNLTTNDVRRLAAGQGREAFVTSLQGKTLGFVTMLADAESILLRCDPGGLEALSPHLGRYGVFDEVLTNDQSAETFELHLAGPLTGELLARDGAELPGAEELAHGMTLLGGVKVRLVREAPTGRPGLTLIGPAGGAEAVGRRLRALGAGLGLAEGDAATFEAARIEAGTPLWAHDVTAENLPQEVGRDAQAISFVKGCYLGQETVARIDALGHVNRLLKGIVLASGATPAPGAAVELAGKTVGAITSAAYSPGWRRAVALAYLRTVAATAGTEVLVHRADAVETGIVHDLPMLPAADRATG